MLKSLPLLLRDSQTPTQYLRTTCIDTFVTFIDITMRGRNLSSIASPKVHQPSSGSATNQDVTTPLAKSTKQFVFNNSTSISTQPASSLCRLPYFIRMKIFRPLLTSPHGTTYPSPPNTSLRNLQPQILRVCRLFHRELSPLLYHDAKLIFSHPSDANLFTQVLSSPQYSSDIHTLVLRVKNTDVKIWSTYFTSRSRERSLIFDFPDLKTLHIRFRGLKYLPFSDGRQSSWQWVRDPKLLRCIESIKETYSGEVRVEVCVKVPDDWDTEIWVEQCKILSVSLGEKWITTGKDVWSKYGTGDWVWLHGVWMRLETDGT